MSTDVEESCGCVFCDIGLEPERAGDEIVHFVNGKDVPWVLCGRFNAPTPAQAPERGEPIIKLLARWHSRLLAEQASNSPVFFPHDKDDGSLSSAILDAMVELDLRDKALRDAQARIAELEKERDALKARWEALVNWAHAKQVAEANALDIIGDPRVGGGDG